MNFVDPSGQIVRLSHPAKRIVSLVPSLTETLFEIGAGSLVVGISQFCTHPPKGCALLPKVGGTKNPDIAAISKLKPDLILLNAEENRLEDYHQLRTIAPCYVSDVRRVSDVPSLLRDLGRMTSTRTRANEIAFSLESLIATVSYTRTLHCIHAVPVIWHKPIMSASGQTYLSDWLRLAGIANSIHHNPARYPRLKLEDVATLQPEVLIFPSEPFSWKKSDIALILSGLNELNCFPVAVEVDGMATNWFGSRTLISIQRDLPILIQRLNTALKEQKK